MIIRQRGIVVRAPRMLRHLRPRPVSRAPPPILAGAGEMSRYLLEFVVLTVGLYSFQQWVFYRTLRKREEEDNKKD